MIKATAPYLLMLLMGVSGTSLVEPTATVPLNASLIHDATVLEYTPSYTDLYIIQIQYKGKALRIYCNTASCYKQRNQRFIV